MVRKLKRRHYSRFFVVFWGSPSFGGNVIEGSYKTRFRRL